jgi:hypothetical protein
MNLSTLLPLCFSLTLIGCDPAPSVPPTEVAHEVNAAVQYGYQVVTEVQYGGYVSSPMQIFEKHWGPYPTLTTSGKISHLTLAPFFHWVPHDPALVLAPYFEAKYISEDDSKTLLEDVSRISWDIRKNGNTPRFIPAH